MLPTVALLAALNVAPIGQALVASVQSGNMLRPNPTAFVGLRHFARALAPDGDFWPSLWRTLVWTAGSVAGAYAVGLALALLLDLNLRGRTLFRALLLIPWVIPEVASAMVWKWLYADEFGVLNWLLLRFTPLEQPVQFLAEPSLAMVSVIVVQVWKLYPVMFVVLLAALQAVPRELHEAAMIDGAGPVARVRYVTLPAIRPTSVVLVLLASIWTFQAFDLVYLLTGGGPAGATRILPTLIYDKAFWGSEFGYATALGLLLLLCLMAIAAAWLPARSSSNPAAAAAGGGQGR